MRNILPASTLERKFPVLKVEDDYIISKNADITTAFTLELPELFTVANNGYETIHSTWLKAIRVLPNYTIIHKQDWFLKEKYTPEMKDEYSVLQKSYERYFYERPYLHHTCYLFLTQTTKAQSRRQSNYNILSRGFIVPEEINPETFSKFKEAVAQFERIINDSGLLRLTRLTGDAITGTGGKAGIIEKYFSLSQDESSTLQDISLHPSKMKIGDNALCLHTLSDTEDLPGSVSPDSRYEPLSTDNSTCRLSFAAPVGLMLSCNHIYNQYIFIDDSEENLNNFEKRAKNMHSLGKYSRSNQINREWINLYLNEARSKGLQSVRAHCNIFAWADNSEELRQIKNEVGSQLASMECKPRHNCIDAPALFWGAIPGGEGEFPAEESFYTFPEQALCFFSAETNYRDSLSPFGIKMCDRLGHPIHLDISDLPMKQGLITNRNKFILGGSGSGKSFFTNHMVRQYWEQNSHVLLIDTGNSYYGLYQFIRETTNGEDGIYFTYTEDNPISFNPFYVEDGNFDVEKKESVKTLILTLWKKDTEPYTRAEEVALSNAINLYLKKLRDDSACEPCFNTFYEFVQSEYRETLTDKNVREKDFDVDNFLNVLAPFYKGGEYDYLLNSSLKIDLLYKRFIVFELDNIKDHPVLFPIVTLIIMETFISKMRKLKGCRKVFLVEEAWKALMRANMAEYIKYLFKTVRKFFGECVVITQELDDIISSPIVRETIINNADCKILLDQRKYLNRFSDIQKMLGLTEREKNQILSINMANIPGRKYKEVWISLGGIQSAVYATEVSPMEYYTYTTEESEKLEVAQLTEKTGSIRAAIKQLIENKKPN